MTNLPQFECRCGSWTQQPEPCELCRRRQQMPPVWISANGTIHRTYNREPEADVSERHVASVDINAQRCHFTNRDETRCNGKGTYRDSFEYIDLCKNHHLQPGRYKRCTCGNPIHRRQGKCFRCVNTPVSTHSPSDTCQVCHTLYAEISELKATIERMREESLCDICVTNKKETAFQCGHVVCHPCSSQLRTCPFCRVDVVSRINLIE